MFKRRTSTSWAIQFLSVIWPKMGWRRAVSYYWHRLKRIPGSPESIAMGVACGVAASMMPFMGLHFLISMGIAWLIRASMIAAAIGTIVGNPWTFPFIWVGTYEFGVLLLGEGSLESGETPFRTMFGGLYRSIETFDGTLFVDQVMPTLLPMIVGSIPVSIIAGVSAYFIVLRPVRAVHKLRQVRKNSLSEDDLMKDGK